jgi:DNA (cytosine-5)-methyltransferase 1
VGKIRPSLESMARKNLWPTPTISGNYNRAGASPNSGDGLETAVKLWPMPLAHDATRGYGSRVGRFGSKHGGRNLNDEVAACAQGTGGGNLSPMWVEWLMGFPIGWTDLGR